LPLATKHLSDIDYSRAYTLKVDGTLNISDNAIKAQYTNFILRATNGEGILSSGLCTLELTNNFSNISLALNAGIVLSKGELLINHLYDFLTIDAGDTKEKISLDKYVLFNFAKKISDFPTSKSDDLMFKVTLNTEKNEYSVGDQDLAALFSIYNVIKTEQILQRAAKTSDPQAYIKNIAPELENLVDDLVKMLPPKKKIKQDIWQKLIK